MVSTLVISQHRCGDDDDFVSYLTKVWIITRVWFYWMFYDHFSARSLLAKLGRTRSLWDALDTTVYNPRHEARGGGVFNWGEILWGWSLSECFASSSVLLHPHSMSGRWHRHLTWSCEPQENTLSCEWWANDLTPYKALPHGPSTLALERPAQLTREELRLFTY